MSRILKFRGKRLDNGEWVYGDLILGDCFPKRVWISSIHDRERLRSIDSGTKKAIFRAYEVDPETVGQFTGLSDVNCKEIYEGDILLDTNSKIWEEYTGTDGTKWPRMTDKTEDRGYKVYYDEKTCQFTTARAWLWTLNNLTEVIGNIHENPELLEVE